VTDVPPAQAAIERYRRLDEGPGPRAYYERIDEGLWMWETVTVNTETIAVKQIEVTSDGTVHRYCWRWLEDADGTLTDQPLYPEEDELHPITRDRFYQVWEGVALEPPWRGTLSTWVRAWLARSW
jgi:hypothetical protein